MTFNVDDRDIRLSGKNSEDPETQSVRSYAVRLNGKNSEELARPKDESINDKSSPDSRKAERVRRDQIRDSINALDAGQQNKAREVESQRRQVWDQNHEEQKRKADLAGIGKESPQVNDQDSPNSQPRWWEKIVL
ncbi:hypothetical protein NW768_008124 [Fusarium equiseti]|uniref:Uncharacterized protein n=1 Tax=Fusarium equiseti TaxID=61235 RepID=A0ABQ8R5V0_FUSEQ|nr:hypothetical protein NW768_008124 [Fusarium equiseti]